MVIPRLHAPLESYDEVVRRASTPFAGPAIFSAAGHSALNAECGRTLVTTMVITGRTRVNRIAEQPGHAQPVRVSWIRPLDRRANEWRGGPEFIRQNGVFKDVFNLVGNPTTKRRILYLVGTKHPMRFLQNNRALSSVLKDAPTAARFHEAYADRFQTVAQYLTVRDLVVEVVDLAVLVPGMGAR